MSRVHERIKMSHDLLQRIRRDCISIQLWDYSEGAERLESDEILARDDSLARYDSPQRVRGPRAECDSRGSGELQRSSLRTRSESMQEDAESGLWRS